MPVSPFDQVTDELVNVAPRRGMHTNEQSELVLNVSVNALVLVESVTFEPLNISVAFTPPLLVTLTSPT